VAKVLEIFNRLVEEKHLVVHTGNLSSHHALRIRLVKLYSKHKDLLDSIGVDDGTGFLSVCASFDGASGNSTYHIQKRKQSAALEFEIVEATPAHG
jgi:hypothetical protein